GTLRQHVPDHARFDLDADTAVHAITFRSDSVLGTLYGDARKVNSLHHQTIDRLGVGYRATGTSTDGVIEAIEAVDRRWIAVQWHPEMMSSRPRDPLFGWLVDEARQ
ncbi:MAG: gamma-glutamyl-gamma-aminobutyrate hydrolase family protein, partial [Acidimicrobiia bacterium]|nr:gamma-glutamyl-gamma-aminobutyrate hydrolase family protein [Acidimicrobiia bacterium]